MAGNQLRVGPIRILDDADVAPLGEDIVVLSRKKRVVHDIVLTGDESEGFLVAGCGVGNKLNTTTPFGLCTEMNCWFAVASWSRLKGIVCFVAVGFVVVALWSYFGPDSVALGVGEDDVIGAGDVGHAVGRLTARDGA